jgi:tRNA-dihydrouridine synthase
MLAQEFPHMEFVANGGIQTLSDVKEVVDEGLNGSAPKAIGAMVGRAAINHPCAFAPADTLWESGTAIRNTSDKETLKRPTRGEVLRNYIAYCDREEDRMDSLGASPDASEGLRRRLVAVPFHLFMGEDGNDSFQRQVKKLAFKTGLMKASSILAGAASFVPGETLDKCVDDHVPWEDIPVYDGYRRSSSLQRVIF